MSLSFKKLGMVCVCIPVLPLLQSEPSYRHATICTSGLTVPVKCIQLTKGCSSAKLFSKYVLWNKEMPPNAFTNKPCVHSAV
jgi:hypothetical protein